jgi:transposase InsO family protein
MYVGFKYRWCKGFGKLYEYSFKHTHMITKSAKKRFQILGFWKKHGLKPTTDAYGVKRSTLYYWDKLYRDGSRRIEALNPKSTKPHKVRERIVDYRTIEEIRRLRYQVCPNMGKDKIKPFLDKFCQKEDLKPISASTIGRVIKDRNIYYRHRKIYHNGRVKTFRRLKKKRLPKGFRAKTPGELVQLDTVFKFAYGVKRYIVTAVDTYTKYSFALTYQRVNSENTKDFFQKLETVFPYRIKQIQTDNGSEFHQHFRNYLKDHAKIIHYYNYAHQPQKQGHIERYNRTIQEEFINRNASKLRNTAEFNQKLVDYLIWYNTRRPHWSLNLKSPVDYLIEKNYLSKMYWTDTFSCIPL